MQEKYTVMVIKKRVVSFMGSINKEGYFVDIQNDRV